MTMGAMAVTAMRRVRSRRTTSPRDTETILAEIASLVAVRQELRSAGASAARLERNRIKIARLQWELSHALIRQYLPVAEAA